MAGVSTALCTSFKGELPQAAHNFTITTGNVFKCALFKATASIAGTHGAGSINYSGMGADEIGAGSGYSAGGFAWTAAQNITPLTSGTSAYWSWSVSPSWSAATFTTCGCMIYNSTSSNKAVAIYSFGGDQTVTAGTFTVTLPTNGVGTSILQLN
jgi:hypothetical protein